MAKRFILKMSSGFRRTVESKMWTLIDICTHNSSKMLCLNKIVLIFGKKSFTRGYKFQCKDLCERDLSRVVICIEIEVLVRFRAKLFRLNNSKRTKTSIHRKFLARKRTKTSISMHMTTRDKSLSHKLCTKTYTLVYIVKEIRPIMI